MLVRRGLLAAGLLALPLRPVPRALADEPGASSPAATPSQQRLRRLGDSTRKLEEGTDLVEELLRRTEQNAEANAKDVRRRVEANAFTAYEGSSRYRQVVDYRQGKNLFLDETTVRQLTSQGRLACAPSVMEACRLVERPANVPSINLPTVKALVCESGGRNCRFKETDLQLE
jgi:hypothetical protein